MNTNNSVLNPYLADIFDELEHIFQQTPVTNEHHIIKQLQKHKITPFQHFSLLDSKDLFSAHFLCMHALYQLQRAYEKSREHHLIIESIRIQRITLSSQSPCIDDISSNSEDISKQVITTSTIALKDELAEYYLDAKHYIDTQEDEINELLASFWQAYIAQDHKQEALATLGLPANADAKMIKKQYLHLAQKHHPDKGGCADTFIRIKEAKSILDNLL